MIPAVLFVSVEQAYARARDSGRLDAALARWRDRLDVLRGFASVAALVGMLRRDDAPWEPKNQVTVGLCDLARERDEDAKLVLMEAYMPALRGVLAEFRGSALEPEDLESEILAGFWATAAKVTSPAPMGAHVQTLERDREQLLRALPGAGLEEDQRALEALAHEVHERLDTLTFSEKSRLLALLDVSVHIGDDGHLKASLSAPRPRPGDHPKVRENTDSR